MDTLTQREEQIFLEALELELISDRHDFVSKRCEGNDELRERVMELLSFHDKTGNILDATTDGLVSGHAVKDDSIRVGAQIGPYKLLQVIGTGGMGVVYMAEQNEPVRRKVAVKIIKLGMDSRNVIARFEAERQALAMMDHPNITKVFDAGWTESGRPYFVMELVTGISLTKYCDKNKLTLRERLELFHKVCNGIQHAHQKGVIHRDLKPSNIMVTHYDGIPVPKIIDFGIAKAIDKSLTDKTMFTSYGNMVGTPEYMSPEQAEMSGLDIDTRSDVYSLGVLLYELLTGTTPFFRLRKKGLHKFCEAICNEEPELASTRINSLIGTVDEISENRKTDTRTLNKFLKGDIDWILAKCMAKDRNKRYATASDIAQDIRRHLNGQPIEAAGPNVSYRFRKFVNKHRGAMAFAAVILVSLIGATIVSTAYAFRANQANLLAEQRLKEVDELRKVAESERDRAIEAEAQLKILNEQVESEAAASAASIRYLQRFPNSKFQYMNPSRNIKWTPPGDRHTTMRMQQRAVNVNRLATKSATTNAESVSPNRTVDLKSFNALEKMPVGKSYKIAIADCGDIQVTSTSMGQEMVDKELDQHRGQVILFDDPEGNGAPYLYFLNSIAEEQRRRFGEDNQILANTLCEIGGVALANKDWESAESSLTKCRKILRKHAPRDPRLAKVELLLGKAFLNQNKTDAAKRSFAESIGQIQELNEIPFELMSTMEDLQIEMSKLNIENDDVFGNLKTEFESRLKKKLLVPGKHFPDK